MSDDAYGIEPPNPARPEPPRREPDEEDYGYDPEPPYPQSVTTAGVLWIIYGCLVLLVAVGSLIMTFAATANAGGQAAAGAYAGGSLCGLVVVGLFAAAFLFVGVQSVRGTARDTLGNGIGSIFFSLIQFGAAAVLLVLTAGPPSPGFPVEPAVVAIPAGIAALTGALLLTAGILALVGRGPYQRWKYARRMEWEREAADRRARRRFYQ